MDRRGHRWLPCIDGGDTRAAPRDPGLGAARWGCGLTLTARIGTLSIMAEVPSPEKPFYSLAEVAEICGRPAGLIRRWVFRRQLPVVWMDDETPVVSLPALRDRLAHPPRLERSLRGRKRSPAGEADLGA